jgi:hypothetical protein
MSLELRVALYTALLGLCSSGAAHAQRESALHSLARVAVEAAPASLRCDRAALASFVKKEIRGWAPKGAKVTVRPWCFLQSQSQTSRPITGCGAAAFEVTVGKPTPKPGAKRAKVPGRFRRWVSGKSHMKVLAGINSRGQQEIFGFEGLTLAARLKRPVVATAKMASELVTDGKARNAIIAGVAGVVAAPVTEGWSATLAGYAVGEVGRCIVNGRKAQKEALQSTVGWVADRARSDGHYPTLDATYQHYRLELDDRVLRADGNLVGAAPWSRNTFYNRLRDLGL